MLKVMNNEIERSSYSKGGVVAEAVRPISGVPFLAFLDIAGNPDLSVDGSTTPVIADHEFTEDCEFTEIRVSAYSSGSTPWADESKLVGVSTTFGKGFKLSLVDEDDADVTVFTPIVVSDQSIWPVYGTVELAGPQATTKAGAFVLKFSSPRRVRAGWKLRFEISFDATSFAFFGCTVAGSV